jgi:hypothetical protein
MPAAQSKAQQRGLDNHQLLAALRAFRRGDFSVRLPTDLSAWTANWPRRSTTPSI